jgi:hypothetical protein
MIILNNMSALNKERKENDPRKTSMDDFIDPSMLAFTSNKKKQSAQKTRLPMMQ